MGKTNFYIIGVILSLIVLAVIILKNITSSPTTTPTPTSSPITPTPTPTSSPTTTPTPTPTSSPTTPTPTPTSSPTTPTPTPTSSPTTPTPTPTSSPTPSPTTLQRIGSPTVTAIAGDRQITLSWVAPSSSNGPILGYKVYNYITGILLATTSNLFYTVTQLTNGTSYNFSVVAYNSEGEGSAGLSGIVIPRIPPSAPLNVTAINNGTYVSLTWNDPAEQGGVPILYYIVFSHNSPVVINTPTTKSAFIYGVTMGSSYQYDVSAVNSFGEEGGRGVSNIVTVKDVPSAPQNVVATLSMTNPSLTLSWTAPAQTGGVAISGYKIYLKSDLANPVATTPLTSYTFQTTPSTSYEYVVRAYNEIGGGILASSNIVTTGVAPGVVTNINGTRGNGSVSLTWGVPLTSDVIPVVGYKIYNQTNLVTPVATTSSLSSTVYGLSNGISYQFIIKAFNSSGEGDGRLTQPFIPATIPSVISSVTATSGDKSIILTWPAPFNGGEPILNYKVYNSSMQFIGNSSSTSYTVISLQDATSYSFYVSAVNSIGESPVRLSNVISTFMIPSQISSISATGGYKSVALSWPAPYNGGSPIELYKIYQSNGVFIASPTTTSYTVTGLEGLTSYSFYVSAVNSIGESPSKQSNTVTTFTTPSQISSVTASAGNQSVILNWTTPSSNGGSTITGYRIYNSTLSVTVPSSNSYTVYNLLDGTAYAFSVSAINAGGEGPPQLSNTIITNQTCQSTWVGSGQCNPETGKQTQSFKITKVGYENGVAQTTCNGYTNGKSQENNCEVPCLGSWSQWSPCSFPCGGGTQSRTYTISQYGWSNGVKQTKCEGYSNGYTETQSCYTCCKPTITAWGSGDATFPVIHVALSNYVSTATYTLHCSLDWVAWTDQAKISTEFTGLTTSINIENLMWDYYSACGGEADFSLYVVVKDPNCVTYTTNTVTIHAAVWSGPNCGPTE